MDCFLPRTIRRAAVDNIRDDEQHRGIFIAKLCRTAHDESDVRDKISCTYVRSYEGTAHCRGEARKSTAQSQL